MKTWTRLIPRLDLQSVIPIAREIKEIDHVARWRAGQKDQIDALSNVAAVGLELLPYELRAVLVNASGQIIGCRSTKLDSMELVDVVRSAATLTRELVHDHFDAMLTPNHVVVGLELGAPVDRLTGTVLFYRKRLFRPETYSSYEWHNAPLGKLLTDATGLHVVILNDADAHAIHELWFGVGQRLSRYAVMLIREGVGGSLVIDKRLIDAPMEIGNIVVDHEGNVCDCGNKGCLEVTAGTTGIILEAQKYCDAVDSVEAIATLVAQGHTEGKKALNAIKRAGYAVARGIGIAITLVAPQAVILYGPPSLLDRSRGRTACEFLDRVQNFTDYVSHDDFKDCDIELRPYGQDVGPRGAAVGALQYIFNLNPAGSAVRGVR